MTSKTLKELRADAKARGLKGYSKWTKDELVRRLEEPRAAHTLAAIEPLRARASAKPEVRQTTRAAPSFPTASVSAASASRTTERSPPPPPQVASSSKRFESRSTAKARAVRSPAPTQAAPPQRVEARSVNEEERVEGAKYALRPNGTPAPQPPIDLGEDIDRLPALTEPALCLLTQKPGVLYAYWLLPPGETNRRDDYKLRLCRSAAEALQVYEEIPVQFERGGWYFHVPQEVGGHEVLVQLGYYQDGKFIAAQWQSTARLPSLYASTRTDHRWWISDEDFARMYLASGGVAAGVRGYGWSGSISSPAAAPGAPSSPQSQTEKRMAWPGNVSSRSQ
jgi:hypothetical protein